jgi:hypothetical protein
MSFLRKGDVYKVHDSLINTLSYVIHLYNQHVLSILNLKKDAKENNTI